MRTPYRVCAADFCGPFAWRSAATVEGLLVHVRELAATYSDRDCSIKAHHEDRADGDTDGLTDDERDMIESAWSDAHPTVKRSNPYLNATIERGTR